MLSRFAAACKKLFQAVSSPFKRLFEHDHIDTATLVELQELLIGADVGSLTTQRIMEPLRLRATQHRMSGADLRAMLRVELTGILATAEKRKKPLGSILLLVGINGSGKTTSAAKLALLQKKMGKRLLLVAADTFRAAALEQLSAWAHQLSIPLVAGSYKQDPAAVVFAGCREFNTGQYDCMIIDTAGRLQTKSHLMEELGKIGRVIHKQSPHASVTTLLTIDSLLGQNSFQQAELFHQSTAVDGIILTKCDGSGRGGIIFPIAQQLGIPVYYITHGESPDAIAEFVITDCIDGLLS